MSKKKKQKKAEAKKKESSIDCFDGLGDCATMVAVHPDYVLRSEFDRVVKQLYDRIAELEIKTLPVTYVSSRAEV